MSPCLGTTLQDLTEAALEEIERQEAAMEGIESGVVEEEDGSVVQEISGGRFSSESSIYPQSLPRQSRYNGSIFLCPQIKFGA